MTFDLNEGHHHVKLAPAVLLTKFGIPRALFNVFDPRGPRGPRTPYPCKTFVATPLYKNKNKITKQKQNKKKKKKKTIRMLRRLLTKSFHFI